jgi:hypothetical protein
MAGLHRTEWIIMWHSRPLGGGGVRFMATLVKVISLPFNAITTVLLVITEVD